MMTAVAASTLAISLLGCADAPPEASDVQSELIAGYAPCDSVLLSDFEKTNSIDRGDHYQVDLTWKFTFTRDVARLQMLLPTGEGLCNNMPMTQVLLAQLTEAGVDISEGVSKGLVVGASNTYKVVKSEKGWVID